MMHEYEWEKLEPAPQVDPSDDSDWKSVEQSKKDWEDERTRLQKQLETLKAKIDQNLLEQIEETELELRTLDWLLSW